MLLFPATSVAIVLIEFDPGVSGTAQLKLPPFKAVGTPLQVTLAGPDRASPTVPATDIGDTKVFAPFAGAVMAKVGGVLSSFTVTEVSRCFQPCQSQFPRRLDPPFPL